MTTSDRDIHAATPARLIDALPPLAIVVPVVSLPWIFGGVQSGVQLWLMMGIVAALMLAVLSIRRQNGSVIVPVALLPLMLAAALGLVQILPLPPQIVNFIAPRNAELWRQQQGQESDPATGSGPVEASPSSLDYLTISLYPASTRRDLALLLGAISLFAIAARFLSRSTALLLLLVVAAVNGAAISFWGLVLQMHPLAPSIASAVMVRGGSHFSTFINKNHAAGFLSISLACAIGLAIWSFSRLPAGTVGPAARNGLRGLRRSGQFGGAIFAQLQALLRGLTAWQLFSLLMIAVITAGIVASMSRGAWVAGISAAAITVYATAAKRQSHGRWMVLVVAAGLGLALVLWMGKGALLGARWNSLWTQFQTPDGRLQHWSDALVAASQFWRLGSGLGTYRFVYLLNSTTPSRIWFYHAENQYLEAAVEGGVLSLAILVSVIVLAALACRRLLAEPPTSLSYALGAAALFALVSQAVHGAFDFGLYIPANMALLALVIGSACGLAAQVTARHEALSRCDSPPAVNPLQRVRAEGWWATVKQFQFAPLTLRLNKVTAAICIAFLTVAMAIAWHETGRAATVEAAGYHIDVNALAGAMPPANQLANIGRLERACELRPDDAEAHQKLAELWILSCRTKLVLKWKTSWADADLDSLWKRTAPLELHGWAVALGKEKDWELTTLRQTEEVRVDLQRAAQHLVRANRSCPLLPKAHLRLAEFAIFLPWLGDEAGHLQRMRNLVSADERLLMEAGFVELQSGRVELAMSDWKRAAARAPQQFLPQILEFAAQVPALTPEIEKLLPEDAACLVELARSRFAGPESAATRDRLLARASQLLEHTKPSPERHYMQGMILALQDKNPSAIEPLQRAVELRPDEINWRYELAVALQKAGNLKAAHEQAGLCWSQEPSNERFERLFRQLVRMQLTTR